jgi:hypothetical protein
MASKYTCGIIVPSTCVPYQGKDLKFLSVDDQPACDANIDDVFDKISIAIDNLQQATDMATQTLSCGTLPTTKTVKTVLQAHADKICALSATVTALQNQIAGQDIANELITINLGCLASSAAPCQQGTNTYSLISILSLFASEICAIKTELGI